MAAAPTLTRAYAWTRIGIGGAMAVAPALVGRPWLGRAGAEPAARATTRLVGTRDAALGVALLATRDRTARRLLVQVSMAVDALDALVSLLVVGRLSKPGALLGAAAASGGVVAGLLALADEDEG